MIGSSWFIGWCATLLWLPSFGDKYGRKKLVWLASVCNVCLYIGLFLTKSLVVMCLIMASFGALNSLRINIGYVFMMEMLPNFAKSRVTAIWCI